MFTDAGVDVVVTDHHEPGEGLPEGVPVCDPKLGRGRLRRSRRRGCRAQARRRGRVPAREPGRVAGADRPRGARDGRRHRAAHGREPLARGGRAGAHAPRAAASDRGAVPGGGRRRRRRSRRRPHRLRTRAAPERRRPHRRPRRGARPAAHRRPRACDGCAPRRSTSTTSRARRPRPISPRSRCARRSRSCATGRACSCWRARAGTRACAASSPRGSCRASACRPSCSASRTAKRAAAVAASATSTSTPRSRPSRELTRFGGHAMAVGATLPAAGLAALAASLQDSLEALPAEAFERRLTVDAEMLLRDATRELAAGMAALEPFGQDNARPLLGQPRRVHEPPQPRRQGQGPPALRGVRRRRHGPGDRVPDT